MVLDCFLGQNSKKSCVFCQFVTYNIEILREKSLKMDFCHVNFGIFSNLFV